MINWESKELQGIANVERGKFSARPRNDSRYYGGKYPFVQTGDVAKANGLLKKYSQTLNEEGLKVSKLFPKGTILITIAANIGDVAVSDLDVACPDSLVAIRPIKNIDSTWLLHSLMMQKKTLESIATQNAQKNINLQVLRPLVINVPPLLEQKKIGDILAVWDCSIDLTERLIAAKHNRRKWLMQNLLTGKRRLPQFVRSHDFHETSFGTIPADWDYLPIGEVAEEVSARNGDGKARPVLSCTKYEGLVDSREYFGRQVFSKDLAPYKIVKRGQFAYATNHIEEGSIGYQDHYDEALISPMYTVFQTTGGVDDRFLYLVLKTETYRLIFASRTSASVDRRGSLRWHEFAKIHVPLPSIEEQRAIVNVFTMADRELALLKQQAAALQEQKKGLMQQLLTGKIRVKVDA